MGSDAGKARDYGSMLDVLRGVTWTARRSVSGMSAGAHVSGRRGTSPEFAEYRPYRQGEDTRRIDWKLLARTNRAFLRLTSDRSILSTMIMVDASASMAFPERGGGTTKWEQACRVAVGLAFLAHTAGDPVGLSVRAAGVTRLLPPRTRRGVVAEAAAVLGESRPRGAARLGPAVEESRAGRIVVITDFLGDSDNVLAAARARIGAGVEVYAVHVVAAAEIEPPAGIMMATDPEDPAIERPLAEATRAAYRAAFAEFRERLAREWRGAGASFAQIVTDERAEFAVRRIVRPAPVSRLDA